jgi:hypothetical protein
MRLWTTLAAVTIALLIPLAGRHSLVAAPYSSTSVQQSGGCSGWAGSWNTDYGTLVLMVSGNNATGTYSDNGGKLTGTILGNVLNGTWSELPTYNPPNDAGDFQFTLSGNGYTGQWRYGSSGDWNSWNGSCSSGGSSANGSTSTPLNSGPGSPLATCISLADAVSSSPMGSNGTFQTLFASLGAEGMCRGLAAEGAAGSDPNQVLSCINGAVQNALAGSNADFDSLLSRCLP